MGVPEVVLVNNKKTLEFLCMLGLIDPQAFCYVDRFNNRVLSEFNSGRMFNMQEDVMYMDKIQDILDIDNTSKKSMLSFLINIEIGSCNPFLIKTIYKTAVGCKADKWKTRDFLKNALCECNGIKYGENIPIQRILYVYNWISICVSGYWLDVIGSSIKDFDWAAISSSNTNVPRGYIVISEGKVYFLGKRLHEIETGKIFKRILDRKEVEIFGESTLFTKIAPLYNWHALGNKVDDIKKADAVVSIV